MATRKGPGSSDLSDLTSKALEELSLAENAGQSVSSDGAILAPSLPPMANKTGEEMFRELNKHPLFMTELEENDELEAIKALAYEGTPAEVGQGFKEQGNECFKEKKYFDAKEFYTKAIQVLQIEQRKREKGEPSTDGEEASEEEVKKQLEILEACLGNRSACHVHLQNYRSCTLDCAQVLRLNPKNVKAYYRSGVALLALDKIAEADDACARGLTLDPSHKDLKALAQQIIDKNQKLQAKRQKETQAEQKKKREELLLKAALKARNIKTRKTASPPDLEGEKVRLVPDTGDPRSELAFTIMLLYPLMMASDMIKEFRETQAIGAFVSGMLEEQPLDYDDAREYTPRGVECYMETISGGLIKVGRNVTLLEVLSGGNVEVVDELLKVFVVPKAKAPAWIRDFKKKKAAQKGST